MFIPRPHRPWPICWIYNEILLRQALLRVKPTLFLATDFNGLILNPYGRTIAIFYDASMEKLKRVGTWKPRGLSESLVHLRRQIYHNRLKKVDHIISISQAVKNDLVEYLGISKEKVTAISLGVNLDKFAPQKNKGLYASYPKYLLHLGGYGHNKNQGRIIDAFAKIAHNYPQYHLYFSGNWQTKHLKWLKSYTTELNLSHRIKYVGYVPESELASLYSNATIFLFPSLEEGFGLPVLESMACATPVITSNCSSLPEVAGDAALKVNPLSVQEIAKAIERLLQDKEEYNSLLEKGLERVHSFSWQNTVKQTLSLIENFNNEEER